MPLLLGLLEEEGCAEKVGKGAWLAVLRSCKEGVPSGLAVAAPGLAEDWLLGESQEGVEGAVGVAAALLLTARLGDASGVPVSV